MKEFVLDGKNMTSVENFYQEVQRVLCPSFRKMGRNLHAFRDVLRGGFGAFDEGETIHLWIIHKKHMKKHLPENFVNSIFKIIEES
ncbi:MAG: barstar family protein, partial [Candidatus Thorarchaeota archaeon]|nr:barstar family protein [Candidatus Thorarchaeota archaeon]